MRDNLLIRSIDRYLALLETGYKIRMTTEEFMTFQANEKDFSTTAYLAFINTKLVENHYYADVIPLKDSLEKARSALHDFYESVSQRDLAFIDNMKRRMPSSRTAFLIAGGYHTEHLKELFKKEEYSYVVLTPIVTQETNQAKYEKLLLEPLGKYTKKIQVTQGMSRVASKSLSTLDKDLEKSGTSTKEGVRREALAENPGGARLAALLGGLNLRGEIFKSTLEQFAQREVSPTQTEARGSFEKRRRPRFQWVSLDTTEQPEGARLADSVESVIGSINQAVARRRRPAADILAALRYMQAPQSAALSLDPSAKMYGVSGSVLAEKIRAIVNIPADMLPQLIARYAEAAAEEKLNRRVRQIDQQEQFLNRFFSHESTASGNPIIDDALRSLESVSLPGTKSEEITNILRQLVWFEPEHLEKLINRLEIAKDPAAQALAGRQAEIFSRASVLLEMAKRMKAYLEFRQSANGENFDKDQIRPLLAGIARLNGDAPDLRSSSTLILDDLKQIPKLTTEFMFLTEPEKAQLALILNRVTLGDIVTFRYGSDGAIVTGRVVALDVHKDTQEVGVTIRTFEPESRLLYLPRKELSHLVWNGKQEHLRTVPWEDASALGDNRFEWHDLTAAKRSEAGLVQGMIDLPGRHAIRVIEVPVTKSNFRVTRASRLEFLQAGRAKPQAVVAISTEPGYVASEVIVVDRATFTAVLARRTLYVDPGTRDVGLPTVMGKRVDRGTQLEFMGVPMFAIDSKEPVALHFSFSGDSSVQPKVQNLGVVPISFPSEILKPPLGEEPPENLQNIRARVRGVIGNAKTPDKVVDNATLAVLRAIRDGYDVLSEDWRHGYARSIDSRLDDSALLSDIFLSVYENIHHYIAALEAELSKPEPSLGQKFLRWLGWGARLADQDVTLAMVSDLQGDAVLLENLAGLYRAQKTPLAGKFVAFLFRKVGVRGVFSFEVQEGRIYAQFYSVKGLVFAAEKIEGMRLDITAAVTAYDAQPVDEPSLASIPILAGNAQVQADELWAGARTIQFAKKVEAPKTPLVVVFAGEYSDPDLRQSLETMTEAISRLTGRAAMAIFRAAGTLEISAGTLTTRAGDATLPQEAYDLVILGDARSADQHENELVQAVKGQKTGLLSVTSPVVRDRSVDVPRFFSILALVALTAGHKEPEKLTADENITQLLGLAFGGRTLNVENKKRLLAFIDQFDTPEDFNLQQFFDKSTLPIIAKITLDILGSLAKNLKATASAA